MTIEDSTDWNLLPTLTIDCSTLSEPTDICKICKDNGIYNKYVYTIKYVDPVTHIDTVLKYGMSCATEKNRYGDRVMRQVAHIESWGTSAYKGGCGADWLNVEQDFYKRTGKQISHTNIRIIIRNFENYPFKSFDQKTEITSAEQSLILHHYLMTEQVPIGNRKVYSEAWLKKSNSYVPKAVFDQYIATV